MLMETVLVFSITGSGSHFCETSGVRVKIARVDGDQHTSILFVLAVGDACCQEIGVNYVLAVASFGHAIIDVELNYKVFAASHSKADILSHSARPLSVLLQPIPHLTPVSSQVPRCPFLPQIPTVVLRR